MNGHGATRAITGSAPVRLTNTSARMMKPAPLSGVLLPEVTGGPVSLDMLRQMGDSGEAFPLIQGDGVMRGSFVIEGISTTRSEFFDDGAARKIEFSIKLKRVDDNDTTFGNTLLNRTAGNLFGRLGVGKLLGSIGNKLGGIL